mmetsp:Transcript_59157/g.111677  ORF Transcript_59157/g.111677 Transcript_59157/m.111677 type:complete len:135 (+) Transcript_59157:246-650(+)
MARSTAASRGLVSSSHGGGGSKGGKAAAGGSRTAEAVSGGGPYGVFEDNYYHKQNHENGVRADDPSSSKPSSSTLERDRQRMRRKMEQARGWQLENQRQRRYNRLHPSTTGGGDGSDGRQEPTVVTVTVAAPLS